MKLCAFCNQPIRCRKPSGMAVRKYCSARCHDDARRVTDISAHFWSKVEKTDGCWLWRGPFWGKRYGSFKAHRKVYSAHRFAYELTYGPIPAGLWVLHRCDNPPCVRPDHLFLGTHQDNMDDKIKKGRCASGDQNGARTHFDTHPRGERSGMAKLTAEKVREIRLRYAAGGISFVRLAKEYGVSEATIKEAVYRQTWKHVTD